MHNHQDQTSFQNDSFKKRKKKTNRKLIPIIKKAILFFSSLDVSLNKKYKQKEKENILTLQFFS